MALHCLYIHAGHSRVTERLLEMAREIANVLVRRDMPFAGPPLCGAAATAATAIYEERGPMVATSEAGWWAVAAQASFALSAWYGLNHEDHSDEAPLATKLHRSIRAGMVCMYGDAPASRLLDFATGDGAGDLLKMIAKVHVELERS
jgi:hypothetical protein